MLDDSSLDGHESRAEITRSQHDVRRHGAERADVDTDFIRWSNLQQV